MTERLVPVIMGSHKDMEHVSKITPGLEEFEMPYERRIISAHKDPAYLLKTLEEYEDDVDELVFVTVAGRSDGLSLTTANNTRAPVVACPPYSDKYAGMDMLSTIRTPSGSSPHLVLEPKNVGLEVAKIYAVSDEDMREKVETYLDQMAEQKREMDQRIRRGEL